MSAFERPHVDLDRGVPPGSEALPSLPLATVTDTVREIIAIIDSGGAGIALVVDSDRRLLAPVTDGDIRRGILRGIPLDQPIAVLLNTLKERQQPIVAPDTAEATQLQQMMIQAGVAQIPLLDDEGRVVGLALLRDLVRTDPDNLRAVVLAGGLGTRLKPLTNTVPKPMLPIGDRPLLEIILNGLRDCGASRVYLAVNYRKEAIVEYFGDGAEIGVPITYLEESTPLGTAGALASVEAGPDPIIVMNGDILTSLDFRAMVRFHRQHESDLTVAVRTAEFQLPFGVIDAHGERVLSFQEKPYVHKLVNAGVYVVDPHLLSYIPGGRRFDMSELIDRALTEGRRVTAFPLYEYWSDVGQMSDYQQAQVDMQNGKLRSA